MEPFRASVVVCHLLRKYDEAHKALAEARRLYVKAGPEGEDGLARTGDPIRETQAAALRDGQRLRVDALQLIR